LRRADRRAAPDRRWRRRRCGRCRLGRCRLRRGGAVDRVLRQRQVDAGLQIEGKQLPRGFVAVDIHVPAGIGGQSSASGRSMKPCGPRLRTILSSGQPKEHQVTDSQVMAQPISRRAVLIWGVVVAAVLALVAAYVCLPRYPDLTHFDPQAMARRESLMWRHYYEKRYFALFRDLYDVGRRQYGFSPLDSARLGYEAASAAR